MDAGLKKKWVAALRSGKYKQGHGQLKRTSAYKPNTYCCLGVLCEVAEVRPYKPWESWLPIDFALEQEITQDTEAALARANDIDGLNFDEIADLIERNL